MFSKITLSVVLSGWALGLVRCKPHCDGDDAFEREIVGFNWLECADQHFEADRSEATACLEEMLETGMPAYVRLHGDGRLVYLYLDDEGQAGVLGWAGLLGRMGDVVYHYHPCEAQVVIEAFAADEPIHVSCSNTSEELCP